MRKKYVYKVSAVALSLSLIASLSGCNSKNVKVDNANAKAVVEQNSVLLSAITANSSETKKDVDKEETVYVVADSNGKVDEKVVSEWLKTNGYKGEIKDKAKLTDIENVKGDETFKTGEDGKITWNSTGEDIYYKGNSEEELPVIITPKYYLDGNEVTAEDIKGKSGKVVIRYEYQNNQKESTDINGKKEDIYTPFVVLTGTLIDTEKFKNVEVTNGKLVSDGTHNIVIGYAVPNLADNLKLEDIEDKEINLDIPGFVEISADVTDFEMGDTLSLITTSVFDDIDVENSDIKDVIDDLDGSADKLSDASTELVDGTGKLTDGCGELDGKMSEFTDGTDSLKKGIKKYTKGVKKVEKGVDQLDENSSAIGNGSTELYKGSKKLKNGVKSLKDGSGELLNGSVAAKSGAKKVDDGMKDLRDGLKQLDEGSGKLKTGIGTVDKGIDTLNSGLSVIVSNNEKLLGASKEIAKGIGAAKQYSDALLQKKEALYGLYQQLSAQGLTEQAGAILGLYGALYGNGTEDNPGLTTVIDKVNAGYNGVYDESGECLSKGFNDSLNDYVDGVAEAGKGVAKLDTGMKDITKGMDSLDDGIGSAFAGSKTLKAGTKSLYDGLGDLSDGAGELNKGTKKLYKGTKDLSSGANELNEGLKKYNSGIKAVDEGLGLIVGNNKELNSGAAKIDEAGKKISDAVSQIHEGTTKLNKGMIKFDKEGINVLTKVLEDDVNGIYERLLLTVEAGQDYQSFAGKTDDQKTQVKFIYKIRGI